MVDFLNEVYFGNSVKQYIVVATIIFFAFLVKKYAAHYVAGLILALIRKRYQNIEKTSFITLVAKPLGLFLAVLVTLIALDKLSFPSELDITVYRISLRDLLRIVGTTLLIITFFLFLIKCIDFIVMMIRDRYLEKGDLKNHQLIFFFKDFIKIIVGLIGFLFILKYAFNYPINNLVTGLSIVGAAIALALKESLENLIASFIIFFDKPFATGDIVTGNNFSGTVENIGLRSTRIRTYDKTYITVPNKQMVDSVVDNLSNRLQRRAILKLEIEAITLPQKVEALLKGMQEILKKKEIQNFTVYLNDVTPAAILINSEYFTEPNNVTAFNVVKQTVNMEVLQLLDKLEIEIAGGITDIKIRQEADATS